MFEESQEKNKHPLWKFIPIAVVIFGILVGVAVYLSEPTEEESEVLTGIVRSGNTEFEWYTDYLKLKDPKIQMGLNFAGNRILMISGMVENNGERSIDVVEVKVTLFNYEEPVADEIRIPVKPGPYSPPIAPLTNRAINFFVETMPEDWKSSHAEIEIVGFRFLGRE